MSKSVQGPKSVRQPGGLADPPQGLLDSNFNRYFYRYPPPRLLEEIEADIRAIEGDIVRMLAEVTDVNRTL